MKFQLKVPWVAGREQQSTTQNLEVNVFLHKIDCFVGDGNQSYSYAGATKAPLSLSMTFVW